MENKEKFLYGASVQGIQSFIFQTNKLKEIAGASELVEEICTSKFAQEVYSSPKITYEKAKETLRGDKNAITFAAGNIKYIFESEADCQKVVLNFPKVISEFAPGITISQAVVKFKDDDFANAVNELENRLRTQRNKPMRSATLGMIGILQSRQTGLPAVMKSNKGEEYYDAGTRAKLFIDLEGTKDRTALNLCKKAFGDETISKDQVAFDIEKMTDKNDWIAIIHADGNGLGQIVQKIGTKDQLFKEFSQNLDIATANAAIAAYDAVKSKFEGKDIIPIRPVVLSGDDLTLICRADLALEYTKTFIEEFENGTKKELGEIIEQNNVFEFGEVRDRLTACAGIAYIKSSYPFYYGYELAEALCTYAKKDAKDNDNIREGKELPQSCLMFHKVQDSFTENYDEISKRELQPHPDISFEFGPYYLREKTNRWTINELIDKADKLKGKEGNAVKSHLRNWMSLLYYNKEMAKQKLERLKSMTSMKEFINEVTDVKEERKRKVDNKTVTHYPVYDILAIHTINTQTTKKEKAKEVEL